MKSDFIVMHKAFFGAFVKCIFWGVQIQISKQQNSLNFTRTSPKLVEIGRSTFSGNTSENKTTMHYVAALHRKHTEEKNDNHSTRNGSVHT